MAVNLLMQEAAELPHPWVAAQARTFGVRALVIKRPTLTAHGVPKSRVSSDVDVEPAHFQALRELAIPLGWVRSLEAVLPTRNRDSLPIERGTDARALADWRKRVSAGGHGAYRRVQTVRDAPILAKVRIIGGAIWPSRSDLLITRLEQKDTRLALSVARRRRLGRGIAAIPAAARAVGRSRRTAAADRRKP